ncbi:MAG: FG-GAP-like repeat-containing protein [Nanoarchaeota archaeon]|nr:FG-GAP-like repeat-containing protein [Nanoarchaeota archaeon]
MKKKSLLTIFVLSLFILLAYVLIVGAVDYFTSSFGSIYYGNVVWKTTLNGTTDGDNFGVSVASGDVNNDGYPDLIVGADQANAPSANDAGQVYVFFGTPDGIANMDAIYANITINGTATSEHLGYSVASGDVNNDSYADIIAGAYGFREGGNIGQVYVFFGAAYDDGSAVDGFPLNTHAQEYANITINGTASADQFGYSVASGDVNNDSYADIIAGAHYADPSGASSSGQAYIFFGANFTEKTDPDGQTAALYANITINGTAASDYFGDSVASGDVNNDSYADIIIGAWYASPSGVSNAGQAYVFFGDYFTEKVDPTLNASDYANITINGTAATNKFGFSVASGDINNDSYSDIIVGAPSDSTGNSQVFVFFGDDFTEKIDPALTALNYANVTINGTSAGDALGTSVSSGDINDDGYADVIAGAIGVDSSGGDWTGQAYVFFGDYFTEKVDPTLTALGYANITINGTAQNDKLGISVASGDVNNDSYADVIVGAYQAPYSGSNGPGRVYIYAYDNTYPVVVLDGPVGFFNETATGFVTFNYTSTDTHLDYCELWGNWSGGWHMNESFISPTSGETNGSTNISLEDGQYVWSVYCNDTTNNYNNTVANFTLTVDLTAPNITLDSPVDFFNETATGNVTFNYTASDVFSTGVNSLFEIDTCELWGNWTSSGWHLNESFVSPPKDATNGSSNITIEDGLYVWTVYCNDTLGNNNNTNANFTLTVDLTAPNITLNTIVIEWFSGDPVGNATFNYTASDVVSDVDTCELWGNWTANGWHLNESFVSPPEDATNGSSYIRLGEDLYVWSVYCNDTLGNYNNTVDNHTLTVDGTTPVVVLNSPADNSYDVDGLDIILNGTAVEDNPDTCTVYFRTNATNWAANASTSYSNDTSVAVYVNLSDAVYVWNIECSDTTGYSAFSSANRTLTVDSVAPVTPTVTEPSDVSISLRDSISYSCESSDATASIGSWAWTLTKPDSTTLSKTGGAVTSNSQSFSGDETNLAGTYTVKCEVADKAGHVSSVSKTFEAHYTTVPAGSGGGGVSADIDLSTEEELTITEKQGVISTFTLDGVTVHTLKITFVDEAAGIVTIVIESTPIEVTLKVGETKEVDVDADGVNDISVTLNKIVNGAADITTKRLAPLPVEKPVEEVPAEEAPEEEAVVPEAPSRTWLWILIIVILVVIGVGYMVLNKKGKNMILSEEKTSHPVEIKHHKKK